MLRNSISTLKKDKVLTYLFMTFILIQPLLDTHYLYTQEVVSKFFMSPSTIIRIVFIAILFGMTLYNTGWNNNYYFIIAYGAVTAIYTVIHIINAYNFYSLVPGNFNFSAVEDIFYIIRLILPLLCILIVFNLEISYEQFRVTTLILITIISGLIVVTNILKISLDSYTNKTIGDNIFSWFTNGYENYGFNGLASKAFFNFANQVATILCMLLPLSFYFVIKKTDWLSFTSLILQILSMLMVGTKVASYGCLLISISMFMIYFFFVIIKKEFKFNFKTFFLFIFILSLIFIILPKSPAVYRYQVANRTEQKYKNTQPLDESQVTDTDYKIEFIKNNYKRLKIKEVFITKSYPYQYDPDFWYEILNEPIEKRLNNRYLEEAMVKRVKEINNNPMDNWFGIGFSRVSNIYNIERDFVNQYYSLGLIGVMLFLLPYVIISLYGIYQCLRFYKEKFNILNISIIFSILLVLIASYFSGNSLDALFVTILLSFICGSMLKFNNKLGENKNENNNYNANV